MRDVDVWQRNHQSMSIEREIDMNKSSAERYLAIKGHSDLWLNKAMGVWYLVGGDDSKYNPMVERCIHVCRLSDLRQDDLDYKLNELQRGYV